MGLIGLNRPSALAHALPEGGRK